MNIYKIVLTGGPCAGKTTVINQIKKELINDNYYVIVVPETASELISSGLLPNSNINHTLKFQEIVLLRQMLKEQNAEEYCRSLKDNNIDFANDKKGIVILYDRGIMDNRAYLSYQDYNSMMEKYNLNELEIIDKYDLVIDLISTATTKPEFYCLDGVRYETLSEAAHKDELTSGAWLLHRNLKVIKPTDNIQEKITIVLNHIHDLLENNHQNELIKFEVDVENTDLSCYNTDNSKVIKIKSFYLQTLDNEHLIIEKRQYNNYTSFIMKKIKLVFNDIQILENKPINYTKYKELLASTIIKQVTESTHLNFINKGNCFTLVKDDSEIKLYTIQDNVSQIPTNIVIKKGKIFTK